MGIRADGKNPADLRRDGTQQNASLVAHLHHLKLHRHFPRSLQFHGVCFPHDGSRQGRHSYGFVLDDLRKDGKEHLYQWVAMLSGGVWQASYPGVPAGSLVLGYEKSRDVLGTAMTTMPPYGDSKGHAGLITPSPGDPLLLVLPLTPEDSGDPAHPLIVAETASGPLDKREFPSPTIAWSSLPMPRKDTSGCSSFLSGWVRIFPKSPVFRDPRKQPFNGRGRKTDWSFFQLRRAPPCSG